MDGLQSQPLTHKRSGLDTPAKKSVQTANNTPPNHYVWNGAIPMSSTTSLPVTSDNHELLSEIRAAVERRIIVHQSEGRESAAPEGFTLELQEADVKEFLTDVEFCGCWVGPTAEGPGWQITSYWSPVDGVHFYVDGDRGDGIPSSEAVNVAAAIGRFVELAESTDQPFQTPTVAAGPACEAADVSTTPAECLDLVGGISND